MVRYFVELSTLFELNLSDAIFRRQKIFFLTMLPICRFYLWKIRGGKINIFTNLVAE